MDKKLKILKEKFKIALMADKPSVEIINFIKDGNMEILIPEALSMIDFNQHTPFHDFDVFEHTMKVIDNVPKKLSLRMAAFFHDISKPDCLTVDSDGVGHFRGHHILSAEVARKVLNRMEYDASFIEKVFTLVRYHYIKDIRTGKITLDDYINEVGFENLTDMLLLCRADVIGKSKHAKMNVVEELELKIREYFKNKNYN